MPNEDDNRIVLNDESVWIGKYPPVRIMNGPMRSDYTEQLDRIEAKLDRLLAILDKDKGLWIAPGPFDTSGFGHWEKES